MKITTETELDRNTLLSLHKVQAKTIAALSTSCFMTALRYFKSASSAESYGI